MTLDELVRTDQLPAARTLPLVITPATDVDLAETTHWLAQN